MCDNSTIQVLLHTFTVVQCIVIAMDESCSCNHTTQSCVQIGFSLEVYGQYFRLYFGVTSLELISPLYRKLPIPFGSSKFVIVRKGTQWYWCDCNVCCSFGHIN